MFLLHFFKCIVPTAENISTTVGQREMKSFMLENIKTVSSYYCIQFYGNSGKSTLAYEL